jgi:hypothetical protein
VFDPLVTYQTSFPAKENVAHKADHITQQFSPDLLHATRLLIEADGAVKVRSIIQATPLPQSILDLTHQYAALCAAFRGPGTEG